MVHNKNGIEHFTGLHEHRLAVSLPVLKILAAIAGLIHLFLIIPDLINLGSAFAGLVIALRAGYAVLVFLILIYIKRIKKFRMMAAAVTLMEVLAVAQFLFVFTLYPNPDFMIQLLGMMLLAVFVFLLPNYWGLMVAVALSGALAFFVMAYNIYSQDTAVRLIPGMIYLGLVIVVGAFFARFAQRIQQREMVRADALKLVGETDPLTQLGNRNMLKQTGQNWFESIVRNKRKLSIVLMDVDNLKMINDQYGHAVGDSLLIEIAKITRSHLREGDICVRWGGDEFVLLLPDITLASARKVAERISLAIKEHKLGEGIFASCSFGIAELKDGQNLEALIKEADAHMYKAKKGGKNVIMPHGIDESL